MHDILVNWSPQETRVAIIENGAIQELHLERTLERGLVGNVYLGKVARVLPGMQSAFIDIGLERAAFLHVADIVAPFTPGSRPAARHRSATIATARWCRSRSRCSKASRCTVQVIKDPIGTKGARLSTQISIAGRLLVYPAAGQPCRRLAEASVRPICAMRCVRGCRRMIEAAAAADVERRAARQHRRLHPAHQRRGFERCQELERGHRLPAQGLDPHPRSVGAVAARRCSLLHQDLSLLQNACCATSTSEEHADHPHRFARCNSMPCSSLRPGVHARQSSAGKLQHLQGRAADLRPLQRSTRRSRKRARRGASI